LPYFRKENTMPLLFDMPLEKLYNYSGTNPKPADFDEFWDRSLEEMHKLDSQIEITNAEFQANFAKCSHLYFTGAGGARIHAKLLQPLNTDTHHPALVKFHGYSGNSGSWISLLPYAAAGFTIAALDCRGQGGLSQDTGGVQGTTLHGHIVRGLDGPPENMLFRHIFLDTAQLAGIVMQLNGVDPERVGCFGGSQGGGLTLACAALEPRIKLAAPDYPFLSDYRRIWELDLDLNAYEELRTYFRMFDPAHEREDEVFTRLGYIDVQNLAPRIKAEVMMTTCLMDQICPPSSQFAAYNKIKSPKSLVIYPDFGHELPVCAPDKVFSFLSRL
jgi:cephalosporin-C deacetylase